MTGSLVQSLLPSGIEIFGIILNLLLLLVQQISRAFS